VSARLPSLRPTRPFASQCPHDCPRYDQRLVSLSPAQPAVGTLSYLTGFSALSLAKLTSLANLDRPWIINALRFANLTCKLEGLKVAIIGYARVSTRDQELGGQIEALRAKPFLQIWTPRRCSCARSRCSRAASDASAPLTRYQAVWTFY
jgi:hypothetical protein